MVVHYQVSEFVLVVTFAFVVIQGKLALWFIIKIMVNADTLYK